MLDAAVEKLSSGGDTSDPLGEAGLGAAKRREDLLAMIKRLTRLDRTTKAGLFCKLYPPFCGD